jgi:hypothetical protein
MVVEEEVNSDDSLAEKRLSKSSEGTWADERKILLQNRVLCGLPLSFVLELG